MLLLSPPLKLSLITKFSVESISSAYLPFVIPSNRFDASNAIYFNWFVETYSTNLFPCTHLSNSSNKSTLCSTTLSCLLKSFILSKESFNVIN